MKCDKCGVDKEGINTVLEIMLKDIEQNRKEMEKKGERYIKLLEERQRLLDI